MDDNSDLPPLPPIGEAEDQPNEDVPESSAEPTKDVREERLGDEPNRVPVNGMHQIGPKEFARRIGPLFGGLFLMYLLVSANFVGELFSCRLQRIFKENYWAKHMLGVATLFLLVNLIAGNAIPWTKGILFGVTVVMYLLFVISNRTTAHTQIFIIGALAIIYALELVRQEQSNILSSNDDEEVRAEAEERRERVLIATYALSGLIMLAIVIGHMIYVGRKKMQLGAEFSYKELFGGGECLKQNMDHDDWTEFKAFFRPASAFSQPNPPAYSGTIDRAHSMTPLPHPAESPRPHFADAVSWFDNSSNMSQYSMQ